MSKRNPWAKMVTDAERRAAMTHLRPLEPLVVAATDQEPHWACPACGEPCRCIGPLRALPHRSCGESTP